MKIKDFVGERVKGRKTDYIITEINGAYIEVREVEKNQYGTYSHYRYETGTAPRDNAFTRGSLRFEDPKLQEAFLELYEEYTHSAAGLFDIYEDAFHRFS